MVPDFELFDSPTRTFSLSLPVRCILERETPVQPHAAAAAVSCCEGMPLPERMMMMAHDGWCRFLSAYVRSLIFGFFASLSLPSIRSPLFKASLASRKFCCY